MDSSSPLPTSSSSALPERDLEKVFRRFDANGDGKVSASEFLALARALGADASPEDARKMVDVMDSGGDGFVDFREFSFFCCSTTRSDGPNNEVEEEEELMHAFKMYDLDGNGRISAEELHRVLGKLGDRKCSVKDCANMIRAVDVDGDGTVDFFEFKRMMTTSTPSSDNKPIAKER